VDGVARVIPIPGRAPTLSKTAYADPSQQSFIYIRPALDPGRGNWLRPTLLVSLTDAVGRELRIPRAQQRKSVFCVERSAIEAQ